VREIVTQQPAACAALIQKLLGTPGIDLVGEALLASHGAGWPQKLLQHALPALVSRAKGDHVAQLARSREAEVSTRLMALDALRQKPDLLSETIKWRPTDVMEPSEIRERFQELRREVRR
jgi:hypothetical protein